MHSVFARVLEFSDLSIAGDLFAIPDAEIIQDLPQILPRLEAIISSPSYLASVNDQSVVEICVTRLTTAIRETGSLSIFAPSLLNLLKQCLSHNLTRISTGEDSPYAKIASDIINCVFLCYTQKEIMELAIPIGIQFLTGENLELSRNMSCYFSLIAIQQPSLVIPYIGAIVRAVLRGNTPLIRILPQLYTVNPKPMLDEIQNLVKLMHKCDNMEKESLLNLCNLIARDSPQSLWLVVGDLAMQLNDPTLKEPVLRVFSHIAIHSGAPFLTHLNKIKRAVDADVGLLSIAASIFGAVGKVGEAIAIDCIQFLISRSVKVNPAIIPYVITEIKLILQVYPNLISEVNAVLSLHLATGNSNIAVIANSVNSSDFPFVSSATADGSLQCRSAYNVGNQPPVYDSLELGLPVHRTARQSPYNSRLLGVGKTAIDVRQISTASSKSVPYLYGSANQVATRQTSDTMAKNLSSSRGSAVGVNLMTKNSHQSLASKGNSRHSLASSGLISAMNYKGSKQSVAASRTALLPTAKSHHPSITEISSKTGYIQSLSPVHSRAENPLIVGMQSPIAMDVQQPLPTFVVENPYLSKSSEAINVRSRRNSRHSLAPRPRSRIVETSNQPQIIQVVPIHDAVYQFCERNLEKIRKYMSSVLVRFPLPARCAIEQQRSRKCCKLFFVCQCKGDQCLYATRFFTLQTKIAKVWIHLMFLAIQAHANTALSQQDSAVHALKLCWDRLDSSKDFSTLVTSAFPSTRDQEDLLKELSASRYFDVFEYNATIKQWGCFLCNYPEKATALFSNGAPLMEGVLKEKKGRWSFLRRWKSRYFTLSGSYLTYRSSTEKIIPIDMRRIRSVKAVNGRGIRSIPTVFEIFTNDNKIFLLKAKDPKNAEQWLQCLQIAMAQSQSAEEYGHIL